MGRKTVAEIIGNMIITSMTYFSFGVSILGTYSKSGRFLGRFSEIDFPLRIFD